MMINFIIFTGGFTIGLTIGLLINARSKYCTKEKIHIFYEELSDIRAKIRQSKNKRQYEACEQATKCFLGYQQFFIDEVIFAQAQVDLENELNAKWFLKEY